MVVRFVVAGACLCAEVGTQRQGAAGNTGHVAGLSQQFEVLQQGHRAKRAGSSPVPTAGKGKADVTPALIFVPEASGFRSIQVHCLKAVIFETEPCLQPPANGSRPCGSAQLHGHDQGTIFWLGIRHLQRKGLMLEAGVDFPVFFLPGKT